MSSKALLLLPLAVVLSFSVQAQLAFDQILIPTTLSGVDMIYVEDLDGDGDNDIVAVSEDSGISWYRNDGSQNFEEFIISTTTSITFPAIHVADTDGDGDKDIISSHDASIVLYDNDGNESFTEITFGTRFSDLLDVVDFDGDGDLDIIGDTNSGVFWYENIGGQNFTQRFAVNPFGTIAFETIDFDQDGDQDIMAAVFNDRVSWYDNEGDETTFTERVVSTDVGDIRDASAIDFDGDGDNDIVCSNSTEVFWFQNQGGQVFGTKITILFRASPTGSNSPFSRFTVVDMDGDGDKDIVMIYDSANSSLAWYDNQGNETFIERVILPVQSSYTRSNSSNLAPDLDLDGRPDVVVGQAAGLSSILWLRNLEDGLPVVANPIGDIALVEGTPQNIDLSNVFTDPDNDDSAITKSIASNTPAGLVNASITNNNLELDAVPDLSGQVEIVIQGLSNGKTVTDTFEVSVTSIDNGPEVANPIADVNLNEIDAPLSIDLSNVFTDPDNDDSAITKSVFSNTPSGLITASITGNNLEITALPDVTGQAELIIQGVSNGKLTRDTLLVDVTPFDDPPVVATPLADINLNENDPTTGFDLSNVFTDPDNDDSAIIKSVVSNTPSGIITVSIIGNALEITPVTDATGVVQLVIEGNSNGKTVEDIVQVTIGALDDPPFVANPITVINLIEDALTQNIDISSVFSDPDNDDANIVKSLISNDNTDLLFVSVSGNTLSITPVTDMSGQAEVIIQGLSNGQAVRDTFSVVVVATDDPPTVANALADISVEVDSPPVSRSLANVFDDVDNPNSGITKEIFNQPDPNLISATIENDSLKVSFVPQASGNTSIVLRATSNGLSVITTVQVSIAFELPEPFNLRANAIAGNAIQLDWDYENLEDFPGLTFQVERSSSVDFLSPTVLNTTPNLTYNDTLTMDGLFFYRIRASWQGFDSFYSDIVAARPLDVPSAPQNLEAELQENNQVVLTWQSTAANALGFRLERASLLTNNNFVEIARFFGVGATSRLDVGLRSNLEYRYRIRAFNESGSSSYSNIATVKTPVDTTEAPPLPINEVDVESVSTQQINLSWSYNLDTTNIFVIERVLGSSFIEGVQDTIGVFLNDDETSAKSFSDVDNLVAGNIYVYRVIIINQGGESEKISPPGQALCGLREVIAVARINNSDGKICEGKSLPLEVIPFVNGASYQWLKFGVPIPGATSRRYLAEETGIYSCVVGVDVCSDTTLINEELIFDGTPPDLSIAFDGSRFEAIPRDAVSYQWYRNFELIPDATDNFYIPDDEGQYHVTASFGEGPAACQATSNLLSFPQVITSVEQEDISAQIHLNPNPGQDELNFSLDGFQPAASYQVRIYDMQGRMYSSFEGQNSPGNLRIEERLDISALPAGTYVFRFTLGNRFGQKLMIKL